MATIHDGRATSEILLNLSDSAAADSAALL
jgi:hypothetical protein